MKCIFIYNPESGRGRIGKNIDRIESKLKTVYDTVDLHKSTGAKDIIDTVKDASEKYDAIIFSGGDGTFNDVAQGLSSCKVRPPLGYIPTGTANDNAHNLKIPRTIRGSLKTIINQYSIKHDVGMINNQYFMYVAGIGACTGTSYTTDQAAKKVLGRFAYVQNGLDEFFSPTMYNVKIKTKDQEVTACVPLCLVLNTVSIGGLRFNPYGHLNDGTFDIVLINSGPGHGRLNVIFYFIRSLFGFRKKKYCQFFKASEVNIYLEDKEVNWCLDGERGPKGDVEIKCIPQHLSIFVPKKRRYK